MNYSLNPFQELYVADTVSQKHFVQLFSRVPMDALTEFHQLFQKGNVILLGSQGCGKTMLLTLFRPEIRKAYADSQEPFPVPPDYSRFLSAGINLTKSGIAHLAGVTLGEGREHDLRELPYFFGDFFNHKLVLDLLENLEVVATDPATFGTRVLLDKANTFVTELRKQDCWAGALDGCSTYHDLKALLRKRLECYRNWMGRNIGQRGAPELLREGKSIVGEPILRTVRCLKDVGILEDIPVFIRVDQIEELAHAPAGPSADLRMAFRQVLNGALSRRDLSVSYRLGSRHYGWDAAGLHVLGGGVLEEKRDFHRVDFDAAWRRTENVPGNFEHFATDAFVRRIKYFLKEDVSSDSDLLASVFSDSGRKRERAESIFADASETPTSYERALAMSDREEAPMWSNEWRSFLSALYREAPLEAVLAAAWGRQTGGGRGKSEHRCQPPPKSPPYPWQRTWWRKERLTLAVLQLSARRGQRLLWWGKKDILDVSGGNILAFLGLCYGIWNQFLKMEQAKGEGEPHSNPLAGESIDRKLQAVGIQEASKVWYDKLAEHKPGGDIRQRFIGKLGNFLRRALREDKSMSYPGGNGFSLEVAVLEEKDLPNREAWSFIKECVGWGALVAVDHTTKKQSGERRIKFYLHPVLSPVFQIPVAHTKEPLYWELKDLMQILEEAKVPFIFTLTKTRIADGSLPRRRVTDDTHQQLRLF